MSLLTIHFFISFGMYSTPKLSKYVALFPFTYRTIQWVPIDLHSSKFIKYTPSFSLLLGKRRSETTPLNLVHFDNISAFQNESKDEVVFKILPSSNCSFTSADYIFAYVHSS